MKLNRAVATMTHLLVMVIVISAVMFSITVYAGPMDARVTGTEMAANDIATAIQGDSAAQLAIGNAAYARGNYAEAFRIYRNISVLGITEAHYRLGLMYAEGLGTRKSIRQAEYWLKLAATQNFPGAAEALASIKMINSQG
jgi:TPR repeat protein